MLLLADDLKNFRIIKSSVNADLLQTDSNVLVNWRDLTFNVNKCKSMPFNRSRSTIPYTNYTNNETLQRVLNFKDIGVFFDTKLAFDMHVNYIQKQIFKTAWFY